MIHRNWIAFIYAPLCVIQIHHFLYLLLLCLSLRVGKVNLTEVFYFFPFVYLNYRGYSICTPTSGAHSYKAQSFYVFCLYISLIKFNIKVREKYREKKSALVFVSLKSFFFLSLSFHFPTNYKRLQIKIINVVVVVCPPSPPFPTHQK